MVNILTKSGTLVSSDLMRAMGSRAKEIPMDLLFLAF